MYKYRRTVWSIPHIGHKTVAVPSRSVINKLVIVQTWVGWWVGNVTCFHLRLFDLG